jgi:hypothetical protein
VVAVEPNNLDLDQEQVGLVKLVVVTEQEMLQEEQVQLLTQVVVAEVVAEDHQTQVVVVDQVL